MLPRMRQRLIIGLTIALGAVCWLMVGRMLVAEDGGVGLSLFTSHSGVVVAVVVVALAGIPALALGLIASATGNPLSGVFGVCFSLGVLAGWGGPIDGWMRRAAIPGAYQSLVLETLIWMTGVVFMLTVIGKLRSPVRSRMPALAVVDHLGMDVDPHWPRLSVLGAGCLAAAVAAVVCYVLLRSEKTPQVFAVLLIAFTAAGVVAYMAFPRSNPVGILLSPMLVAIGSYGYMLMKFFSHDAVLRAWYTGGVPGPALVLPIYYASFGVAGAAMGVGMAQALTHSSREIAVAHT